MAKFSKVSASRLATCDQRLQDVMNAVIKRTDISIQYGHRTVEEQMEIFKKGRQLVDGKWVKVGKTTTDKDGTIRKSMHNYYPSRAVDIAPSPLDWKDIKAFIALKNIVFEEAAKLGVKLTWGADWDGDGDIAEHSLQDYPHYELKGV